MPDFHDKENAVLNMVKVSNMGTVCSFNFLKFHWFGCPVIHSKSFFFFNFSLTIRTDFKVLDVVKHCQLERFNLRKEVTIEEILNNIPQIEPSALELARSVITQSFSEFIFETTKKILRF